MRYFHLVPLDTLFFRDGSPFGIGETGQMEVRGVFPPSPTTVAGSLRAAFARQLGWNGDSRSWDASMIERLGEGDNLAPLRFSGLYLARDGEPLFPAPLHLLRGDNDHLSRLKPGGKLRTDIGVVRLPEAEGRGFKPLENTYLTPGAMRDVLDGGLPDPTGIIPADRLWVSEARVGIERDKETRTTGEDSLYQTVHAHLHPGVGLVMGVDGYDGSAPGIATLGGESRMVSLESHDDFALPEVPVIGPSGGVLRYTATLITPAAGIVWRPGDALSGEVVSACIGRPVMIGGWDGRTRRPKGLEPHLPAGSTWFMEAREDEREDILRHHGTCIGEKTEWGYGQVLIGAWR